MLVVEVVAGSLEASDPKVSSAPSVDSADAVGELWRSKKRCCVSKARLRANHREFYKACYEALGRHYNDEHLVVKCLWLMDAGADALLKLSAAFVGIETIGKMLFIFV